MKINALELEKKREKKILFSLGGRNCKKWEQKTIYQTLTEAQIYIEGNPLFRLKVRRALKKITPKTNSNPSDIPIKFIVSSGRIKLDRELGILYLKSSLSFIKTAEILKKIYTKRPLEKLNENSGFPNRNALFGFWVYINRKILRISIEHKLENAVIKIITSPPMGKVATEDQHFLMIIMRLQMFIKKIAQRIEKRSVVLLLQLERKKTRKTLMSLQRRHQKDFNTADIAKLGKKIKILDSVIHHKRLLIQRKLFDRVLFSIRNWQPSPYNGEKSFEQKSKLLKIEKLIDELNQKAKDMAAKKKFFFTALLGAQVEKKLINLRRKRIKYKYLLSIYDKNKKFSEKLKNLIVKNRANELIPSGYIKPFKAKLFDILRFFLNLLFVSFYIYLINVSLPLVPIFLILGLFVFQPIANKFAVLFMSFFVKNRGLKRLSMFELKDEIARKGENGKYLCAIDLPIYTGKLTELETTVHYIFKNLNNLKETLSFYDRLAIIYQITSNTSKRELIDEEIESIRKIQKFADNFLGENRVYFLYLHRSSSVAKKVGNIVASHLFKYHGFTCPEIYTDSGRFMLTLDRKPIFDRVYGNFSKSLCRNPNKDAALLDNDGIIKDILRGKRIKIKNKIDFTFFVDNKNEIKKGSLEKALAIMMHYENANIGILQPEMSIEDPISQGTKVTSAFLRMMRIARDTHNLKYLNTLHGLYNNMSAYYGKGMLRLKTYDYMVMNEVLNLKYVDSHDWQESVFNNAVLAVSGDNKANAQKRSGNESSLTVLIEKKDRSELYSFDCSCTDECRVTDENKNMRTFLVPVALKVEEKIELVMSYIDNGVEVGERELISTIGNQTRDIRWLKGDLQMFNTFMPYVFFLPSYHKFHLENIFRRFTNEAALSIWVFINFLFAMILPSIVLVRQEILFILSLYLAVTAFGFSGIDLFLYPVVCELNSRIRFNSDSKLKLSARLLIKILNRIVTGLWQFFIYILVAWPRVLLGIKSTLKVLFSGMDKPVDWGNVSNASISVKETNGCGIPMKKFFSFYLEGIIIGAGLGSLLIMLVMSGQAFISIIMPLNMGIIVLSLLAGPVVSFLISKKIKTK